MNKSQQFARIMSVKPVILRWPWLVLCVYGLERESGRRDDPQNVSRVGSGVHKGSLDTICVHSLNFILHVYISLWLQVERRYARVQPRARPALKLQAAARESIFPCIARLWPTTSLREVTTNTILHSGDTEMTFVKYSYVKDLSLPTFKESCVCCLG